MKTPKIDRITFLVNRRFPGIDIPAKNETNRRQHGESIMVKVGSGTWEPLDRDKVKDARKYREEVSALEQPELDELYEEEIHKKNLEDDLGRFFSRKFAEVDFDYWSKMTEWTFEEAIVL